jgi:thiamine biosynthesis lipoprotein
VNDAPQIDARHTIRVMSCEAALIAVSDALDPRALDDLLIQAARRLRALEALWSRFRSSSEVSRLNAADGSPLRVSQETVQLVEAMVHGWHATDGCFDPTLLGTLVELGYAQSRDDGTLRTSLPSGALRRGRPDQIRVDRARRIVQLPAGTTIDPGGVGKGLAADIVVDELIEGGASGALVEIGGDIRVSGPAPDAVLGWLVDVDTTGSTHRIALGDGGVATSTSRLRTWTVAGSPRHHLVDPATLDCSATDAVSCTVVAGTAAWSEVFTKTAFAMPTQRALTALERHGLAASITTTAGDRITTTAWEAFAR